MQDGSLPYSVQRVLVAIAFNEKLSHVISSAVNLCREMKAELILCHVIDQWRKSSLTVEGMEQHRELEQQAQEETIKTAQKRLERLAGLIGNGIHTEVIVGLGDVAKELSLLAVKKRADLVLTGSSFNNETDFTGNRYLTLSEIVNQSTIPIMIINRETKFVSRWPRHRILIADDLRPKGKECLKLAYSISRKLDNGADFLHVHVIDETSIKGLLKEAKADTNTAPQFQALLASKKSEMISNRNEIWGGEDLIQGSYHFEVLFGRVQQQITEASLGYVADIIIFGQHEVYHRHPIGVGSIPFKNMLNQQVCVIIIP